MEKFRQSKTEILQEDHKVEECFQAYLSGKIPSLSLGISGLCNMACLYCDRRSGTKKSHEISANERVTIFEKLIPFGIKVVDFCLEGEPLLDPAFWSIIEIANKNGILPFTFSNLTLINNLDIAKTLLKNNVTIAGKMDRVDDFDDLLGKQGASIKIKQGLEYLLQAGYPRIVQQNNNVLTKLSMVFVPTALNFKDIRSVAMKCQDNSIFLRVGELELVGRAKDNAKQLALEYKLLNWVYDQISEVYGYSYLNSYKECCFNVLGLMVGVDGNIFVDQYGFSCPFVFPKDMGELKQIYIGNALEDPIDKMWTKIERIRKENVHLLEKRIERVLKSGNSLGCSGKSDVILKKALSLVKMKHSLSE